MNRLSQLLEDAAAGPVGFDHSDIGVRVRRRQRRSRVAVASMLVLFAGVALIGTNLGSDDEQRIDMTGTSQEQTLAEYLVTDATVREQFPELSRSDTTADDRDYIVLGDAELSGPTEDAVAGVARNWSQPYTWSAEDPVSNQIINVMSTAIRFPSTDDARSTADEILGLLDVARTPGAIQVTSDRFDGHCEPAGPDPDPRSCLATTTVGNVVVAVQMNFAGPDDRLAVFERLLDSAGQQVRDPSRSPTQRPSGTTSGNTSRTTPTTTSTTAPPSRSVVATRTSAAWVPGEIEWLDGGSLRAVGYNEFVEGNNPGFATEPTGSAEALLGERSPGTTFNVAEHDDGEFVVTVITEISGDDSVAATREVVRFADIDGDGRLEFVDGTWAQRCARGINTEDFASTLCP